MNLIQRILAAKTVLIDGVVVKSNTTTVSQETEEASNLPPEPHPTPVFQVHADPWPVEDPTSAPRADVLVNGRPMTAYEYLARAEHERLEAIQRRAMDAAIERAGLRGAADEGFERMARLTSAVQADEGDAQPTPVPDSGWAALEDRIDRLQDTAQGDWGHANIKSPTDIVVVGPLGRRSDLLRFWPTRRRVRTGCFEGSVSEFKEAVLKSYSEEIAVVEADLRQGMGAPGYVFRTDLRQRVMQLEAWRDQYLVLCDALQHWQRNPEARA